ncbi:TPA: hypothetical protein ACH3X1_006872 [Trebouxia sp. C0004]
MQIAVRAVESEQTKLDRVLKLLGFLHQHFSGVLDAQVRQFMLDGLENRFADYDQPALVIAYMLNPNRQQLFLNPNCDLVSWRNAVILVEVLYIRFFPDATEASKSVVADQFLAYINHADPFDDSKLQSKDAPELCQLALRLMGIAMNSAGCERLFSQMGLTHTKVRNRLGHAKVTHIAQLRQELHRHRPTRKKAQVMAGAAASSSQTRQQSESQLMDLDALTSAPEFHMTVNAWMADIDAEQRQAYIIPAYQETEATTKDTFSNIVAPAILPLLDDDSVCSY